MMEEEEKLVCYRGLGFWVGFVVWVFFCFVGDYFGWFFRKNQVLRKKKRLI